ncbi:aminotransferase class I/II-fold pyridoxal phosphate-dependent enzyme [Campylobacter insulaenigrae]|uniref:aminotransferase class I/II-fold pyridoxal phosphate-dependent enzyme n=1 Tax=Campylobacter insulaenigrae TaxID=260714 RepID=UPI0021522E42|nr:pyridoxal phosphate-dependent aminotransferase family protein [Campylobacter insulaenigrae]MCR6572622.1 pyridoxal phosphate-dependent aminotransferase family protein [Campylobacter insulaenigrae]MCR6576996.1 pyridoxal phosphate-dependent aminotransferase family protein [Campylobacter insulaenigrae]MCR6579246.1 pyridoxal phosphate-dependent aminotransferase family protein [Campylobacter insulaenigrae]MCR6581904.1 pyridoxal phosphate-dependent aminotransferase family protein [Campylobacter ins
MQITQILDELKQQDNFRILRSLRHDGKYVIYNEQKLLNLAGNDYLNLSNEKALKQDFLTHLKEFEFSSSSSRSLSGNYAIFDEFESFLEAKLGRKILHFNNGYALNISCLQALASIKNTLFLADKQVHASIIDGLRLGGAKFIRFKHNDIKHLQSLIQKHYKEFENIIIISEALFSMDGDFAPIKEFVSLKKEFKNIKIYIDEAHSVGCFGNNGLGYVKFLGLEKEVDFLVFTFGKAIASMGACMISDEKEFFINKARAFIYSTAIAPINVAWTLHVFKHLHEFNTQRKELLELSTWFKNALASKGAVLGEAYIISFVLGQNTLASKISQKLLEKGVFAPAIKEPTVAKNTARIRFSLHAGLVKKDLEEVLEVF